MHGPKPYDFMGKIAIHGPKPYEFMCKITIDDPKPYEFIGEIVIQVTPNPVNKSRTEPKLAQISQTSQNKYTIR